MKKRFLLFLVPFLLASTSCTIIFPWQSYTPESQEEEEEDIKVGKHQVFLDNHFERGFLAIPGAGTQMITGFVPEDRYSQNAPLRYGSKSKETPIWTLRQNNDVYNLNDKYNEFTKEKPAEADGYYIFADQSKKLLANPSQGKVYLELNSDVEYGNGLPPNQPKRDRYDNEQWAHLLIASSLKEEVKVSDTKSLTLNISIQMTVNQDLKVSKAFDDEMILYLQLKSGNPNETSDKPLWFGIPFFNSNSSQFNNEYARKDTAEGANSGGFIYKFAANKLYTSYQSSLVDNKIHNISLNLKQYFENAINAAHNQSFWTSTKLEDLIITDMNFGFELPGRRKLGVEFSALELIADYGNPEERN